MNTRAAVIGIGMVGGSVAAALKARGWWVTGIDADEARAEEAKRRGIIDAIGPAEVDITFVATPVSVIPEQVHGALAWSALVTDVGSAKALVADAVQDPRFVPGHPMAGSEKAGLDGVNANLFQGATWVLTPVASTDPQAYVDVREIVTSLGADVVTLEPRDHDEIVATISHVPHLVSTVLMDVASKRETDHAIVLRLAAGGFRDMTRIAAGHPVLWTDIVMQNRSAIRDGLARVRDSIDEMIDHLDNARSEELYAHLASAAQARKDLPLRQGRPSQLASLAVVIPDRPGALDQVFTAIGASKVNVEDLEINHSLGGTQGTLLLTVDATRSEDAVAALEAAGFAVGVEAL